MIKNKLIKITMAKNSSNKTRIKLTFVIANITQVTKRINSSPPAMDNKQNSMFLCNLKPLLCVHFKEHPVIQGTTQCELIAPTSLYTPEECKALPKHVTYVNDVSSDVGVFGWSATTDV
jgi:hypothetical protein